eukprot:COSAG01_NODE_8626_length_2714_cov_24.256881_2_plen_111_part_00
MVDVREAADAHVAALRRPECAQQRYIIADDSSSARMSKLAEQTVDACPEFSIRPAFVPGWQLTLFFQWPLVAASVLTTALAGVVCASGRQRVWWAAPTAAASWLGAAIWK